MNDYIPLSNNFTVIAIVGAIVFGWLTIFETLSLAWGFTLTFMFIVFIIASMVSITPQD